MSVKELMHTTGLYDPYDPELFQEQLACLDKLHAYNRLAPSQLEERTRMLREMFADFGEGSYVEIPFYSNFAGRHVHFGKNVYANFNLTLVDDTHIYVGDNTMCGPNVTVATAGHPIDPELRSRGLQYNAPVTIGKNCWIGAGAILLPGVTVGDHTVIGAGSVVTKDIPSGVVAVGNPCRVLRQVGDHDRQYYFRDHQIPLEMFQK